VTGYALNNASPHGVTHLDGISGMYDRFSYGRIVEAREPDGLAGARCLEVGAGNGSFALLLADQVGPDGSVLALDLDTSRIPEHKQVTVQQRDLMTDALPEGPFDLIHGRLILGHLPPRADLLSQLCGLLAPGGAVAFEEFYLPPGQIGDEVLAAPASMPQVTRLWNEYAKLRMEIFATRNADPLFPVRMEGLMRAAGLADTQRVAYTRSWRGGGAGASHALGTLRQFQPELVRRGFGADDIEVLAQALGDPEFHLAGRQLISTSGRRPM
jgi:SAM-dependent methyltransferase